jgi:hypothetical protein
LLPDSTPCAIRVSNALNKPHSLHITTDWSTVTHTRNQHVYPSDNWALALHCFVLFFWNIQYLFSRKLPHNF